MTAAVTRKNLPDPKAPSMKFLPVQRSKRSTLQPKTKEPRIVRAISAITSPGFSADDQAKLFGKFARLSAKPTGGEKATGLGLSIVKKMVESMNGKAWCESEAGRGATFIVELPVIAG